MKKDYRRVAALPSSHPPPTSGCLSKHKKGPVLHADSSGLPTASLCCFCSLSSFLYSEAEGKVQGKGIFYWFSARGYENSQDQPNTILLFGLFRLFQRGAGIVVPSTDLIWRSQLSHTSNKEREREREDQLELPQPKDDVGKISTQEILIEDPFLQKWHTLLLILVS